MKRSDDLDYRYAVFFTVGGGESCGVKRQLVSIQDSMEEAEACVENLQSAGTGEAWLVEGTPKDTVGIAKVDSQPARCYDHVAEGEPYASYIKSSTAR